MNQHATPEQIQEFIRVGHRRQSGPDDLRSLLENESLRSNVPVELLYAAGEQTGAQTPEDFSRAARMASERLGPRFQSGEETPEQIVASLAGDDLPAFTEYTQQINRTVYPDDWAEPASQDIERRSIGEKLALGARGVAEAVVGGVGRGLQIAGAEEAGEGAADWAESTFGQSEEEQAQSAAISEANGLWSNLMDATVQGAPSFAASIASGAAGGAVGGAVAGPLGAAVGAIVGSAATIAPMMLHSAWETAEAPQAATGAPIISADGIVESGNGRTMAIQRVYGEGAASAGRYRRFLEEQGYPVENMRHPVLVRIRQGEMSRHERQAFGAVGRADVEAVMRRIERGEIGARNRLRDEQGRFLPARARYMKDLAAGSGIAARFDRARKAVDKAIEATGTKVEVPAWLDVDTDNGRAVRDMLDRAATPVSTATSLLKWIERNMVNSMTPIRDLELNLKGQLGVGMDSAFKSAEVAVNDAGRNEALMFYGAAEFGEHGEFRVKKGTIGIRAMLEKIGGGQELIDWMSYMGARRAQEIRAKGLKTPLSDSDIAHGLSLETSKFKEVAADWKRFNNANVDFLVAAGRISKELAEALKADAAYIPFYRSDETMNGVPDLYDEAGIRRAVRRGPRAGGQVAARDPGIAKMKGGDTLKIDNLIDNMIRNSQAMVAAGMRNRAANQIYDLMVEAGYARREPATAVNVDGKQVAVKMPQDAVRMWRDGEESYIVPETADAIPLIVAMGGLDPVRLTGITSAMAKIGSFFRQSITLSPAFVVRNMIRDAVSTGVLFGGRNLTMSRNMFTGFKSSLRNSASRQAFSAQSGMGDFRFGGADIGLGKNDLMMEMGIRPKTLGYRFRQVVGALEQLGTASELSNRLSIYEALIAEGVRPDEAAYQSLTIVNYGRRGANNVLRHLTPLVPFLNARIQGIARMGEDVVARRGRDRQQALMKLAINGAVLSMFSALLWGWNNEDEERKAKYEAEPLHRRLNYHIIYFGDRKVMIPKAFEIGTLFGTVPELFMEAAIDRDTEELGKAAVMTLTNTFSFNPIPAAMLPALEVIADYDSFTGARSKARACRG